MVRALHPRVCTRPRNRGIVLLFMCSLALGLGATAGYGQWLEKTVMLPDTLGWLSFPWSLVHNPQNNKIYVGCDDGILVIDGTTSQRLARIKMTGGRVWALCYNPQNNRVYAADLDRDYVFVIGGESDSVITLIGVGREPYALCYNAQDNKVYCTNHQDKTVTVIDGAANRVVATVDVGNGPCYLCYNPEENKVYCANEWSGDVTVIDGVAD
jgi:YVTN family beta-propeller protein